MTLAEVMKPYLWLAAIAFFVGFVSYLTLGSPAAAFAEDEQAWPAEVSAPVSDEWNLPKRI
jgi:hypothetical protein